MKTNKSVLLMLLVSFVFSIVVFGYLTNHHYDLKLGQFGPSFCQVSETLNCDVAAQSQYAELAGIPIALIGLVYSVFMLLFFGAMYFDWMAQTAFKKSLVLVITGASFLASLGLGYITITELKAICPFCVVGYVLSLAQLFLSYRWVKAEAFTFNLFSPMEGGVVASLFVIPFASWIIAKNVSDKYGFEQIKLMTVEKVEVWKRATAKEFDYNAGLIKGNPNSSNTIVEFADFKCPHCKVASDTLKNFNGKYPDAKIVFKPFPLDGECNPSITSKGDKSRCLMAAWTLCSEKINQKGWLVHDWLFENQPRLFPLYGDGLAAELKAFATENQLSADEIQACATSTDMMAEISKIADEGKAAEIQGTPTIFVNGRKLEAAQVMDVLKAAYSTLQ